MFIITALAAMPIQIKGLQIKMMKLIHYTGKPIESLERRCYKQNDMCFQAKPTGLWISVEGTERFPDNYTWKEWCESEGFAIENLAFSYEVILADVANILHLKTSDDINEFTKLFPLKSRHWPEEIDTYQLDWNSVKEKYQGIIISPYQWDCRLNCDNGWYYGWDCSSGCIWDIGCIKEFNLMKEEGE